jgi:FixJ family two-component response regulator
MPWRGNNKQELLRRFNVSDAGAADEGHDHAEPVFIGRPNLSDTHRGTLMVPQITSVLGNDSIVGAPRLDFLPPAGSWRGLDRPTIPSCDTTPCNEALADHRLPTRLAGTSDVESIVFIIDDDAQVRSNLTKLCRSFNLNVNVFSSPNEFLNAPRPDLPACVVLETLFPGSAPSGLEFQRILSNMNDFVPIIFLTGHGDVQMSVKAIKRGALEFLTKPVCEQELLNGMRNGIERDRERRKKEQAISCLRKRYDSLSTREREILHLVTRGLLNKQVGAELNLSLVTIKGHRARIMQKMAANSLAELVRMSDQLGRNWQPRGPSH